MVEGRADDVLPFCDSAHECIVKALFMFRSYFRRYKGECLVSNTSLYFTSREHAMKYATIDRQLERGEASVAGNRRGSMGRFRSIQFIVAACLAGVLSFVPIIGHTDDHKDHERARKALLSGEVLSLRQVLDMVAREYPGEPVEIEFEQDDGLYVYEIKLLQPSGSILKMKIDATSGKVIKVKGRDIERRGD
jgi:hypothetical protein